MFKQRFFWTITVTLLLLVGIIWISTTFAILHPHKKQLMKERSMIVIRLAHDIERRNEIPRRAQIVAEKMDVEIHIFESAPVEIKKGWTHQHGKRELIFFRYNQNPAIATILTFHNNSTKWLVLEYQTDLENPAKWLNILLIFLGVISVGGSYFLTQWVFAPLEKSISAMQKIADGDLQHRVDHHTEPVASVFNQMAERVEQTIEGQRRLIAAISHELRTPITRLRLRAEIENKGDMIHDIQELEELVSILLTSSKLQNGVWPIQYTDIDIKSLLYEVLANSELDERMIHIDQNISYLRADGVLVKRIFENLISNFIKYCPNTSHLYFEIKEHEHQMIVMTFSDDGPGVDANSEQFLFDPFFREEKSRNKMRGGLGLGLMLVKQIVECHNGNIVLKNRSSARHGGLEIIMKFPSRS